MENNKKHKNKFGIELEKYFKFNSSHFVAYKGFREPLHGHNYKVSVRIMVEELNDCSYVTDFDNIKNILRDICDNLKHCMLIPKFNEHLIITSKDENITINFPSQDVKIIETNQISAECLSEYICKQLLIVIKKEIPTIFLQSLNKIELKVYEDKGKCGIFVLKSFE